MRRSVAAAAVLIAAGVSVARGAEAPPAGGAAKAGAPPAAKALEVRVLSFNIRYGAADDGENRWENRRGLVFGLIREHRPDIAGLQEVMRAQEEEIAAALPAFGVIGAPSQANERRAERVTVLYRKDRFAVDESGTFWFSDTPDVVGSKGWGNGFPRICTWARLVDRKAGRGVYIFNAHPDHESQPSREKSTLFLVKRIAERKHASDPVLVTGDFNAGEDNPAVLTMTKPLPPKEAGGQPGAALLVDTFRVLHADAKDVGTYHAFKGRRTRAKIDFVFASPAAKVLEAEILHDRPGGRWPSDHFPVFARVSFPPAADN